MILDPKSLSARAMYNFMIGVVVPRPIAFVSTVSGEGAFNVAPFSYFNAITNRPPLVGISINRRGGEPKDTARNIQETGDFVVNVVSEALLVLTPSINRLRPAAAVWTKGAWKLIVAPNTAGLALVPGSGAKFTMPLNTVFCVAAVQLPA